MSPIVPAARPEITRAAARDLIARADPSVNLTRPVILGRRAYYRDTMGRVGANDFNIYDDAIILVSPTAFVTFNANTDPSRPDDVVGRAMLMPGTYLYTRGWHAQSDPQRRRPGLVQAGPVVVHRARTEHVAAGTVHAQWGTCLGGGRWKGWFGINHHDGGVATTSSEGCQTIPPGQWAAYLELVTMELARYGMTNVPYVLTEREAAHA